MAESSRRCPAAAGDPSVPRSEKPGAPAPVIGLASRSCAAIVRTVRASARDKGGGAVFVARARTGELGSGARQGTATWL